MATSGKLRLTVIEAKLTRDTDFWSKMDPFCVLNYREQQFKTKVKQNAGKLPKWDETFEIDVKYIGDELYIGVKDEDLTKADVIGDGQLKLSALCVNGGLDEWFDIFYKGKNAGKIHLKGEWFPSTGGQPQQVNPQHLNAA